MTNVLIIDDEETIRFSFGSILTDAGYNVIKAAHPIDAKAILGSNRIDVAIVDRLIESYNGMDLVAHINKVQSFCTTILISAFPTFKSASEGFKHKIFAYLQKPVKKEELCKIVKDAVLDSKKRQSSHYDEQALIQAQKIAGLGMLSGGIVHDFNNIFMLISGRTDLSISDLSVSDLSISDLPAQSPLTENLKQIQNVSNHGRKLVQEILSYMEPIQKDPEHMSIQILIQKAMLLLKILVPKTIEINENLGNGNDTVCVHPVLIEQVILNIGTNAMQAMENYKGTIDINIASDMEGQNRIHIFISDTGCGMDQNTLKQIFDPFFSTKPREMGTGIGLSTAQRIIKNHGGEITAESRPGEGSVFHIWLPITTPLKDIKNK